MALLMIKTVYITIMHFFFAKELNIARVSIKGNKLLVNSSSYTVDNIPDYLLPPTQGNER